MRKLIVLLASAFILLVTLKNRAGKQENGVMALGAKSEVAATLAPGRDTRHLATEVIEENGKDVGGVDVPAAADTPVFFPKAKVVARVSDPPDAEGRQRVIETVETGMRERFVRVERTLRPDTLGNSEVQDEVAMVANQLLLQRPDSLGEKRFLEVLTQAGAIEVKELGDAYLATFAAVPANPRALDGFIARVREVAGTELTIEPNYIRKLF